jgi:hypothetical protein
MIPKIQPIAKIQNTKQYKNRKQAEFDKFLKDKERKVSLATGISIKQIGKIKNMTIVKGD